ncbi:hypothetical protein [Streptacidiphilus sp. PAMC 29251]
MTDIPASERAPAPAAAEDLVGARPRAEVERAEAALEAAAAAPQRQTALSRGALAGYLWALGRGTVAPVTGDVHDEPPDLLDLTAEIDASEVSLAQQAHRTVPRDYVRGVHDALSWVCAHSDEQP